MPEASNSSSVLVFICPLDLGIFWVPFPRESVSCSSFSCNPFIIFGACWWWSSMKEDESSVSAGTTITSVLPMVQLSPPCNLFPSLAAEFPVRFLEAVTFCWSFPLRFVWKASRGWSGRSVLSQLGESSGSVFCPGANAFALETALGCFTVITFPFPCQSRGDLSVSPHSWWGPSRVLEVKPAEVWEPPPNPDCFPRVSHSHARSQSLQHQFVAPAASASGKKISRGVSRFWVSVCPVTSVLWWSKSVLMFSLSSFFL